ncbi:serine/threonine protein kinase [Kitasatospora sp. NE20-6]|uniref:protein kinase family protein n=1 Tax=Kitasatospora sp. NE20-6 TaxID=2859066 RepID=UPI0034DBEC1D
MADGTKSVVDASVADETALAMAVEDFAATHAADGGAQPGDLPDAASDIADDDSATGPADAVDADRDGAEDSPPDATGDSTRGPGSGEGAEGAPEVTEGPAPTRRPAQAEKAAAAAVEDAVTARGSDPEAGLDQDDPAPVTTTPAAVTTTPAAEPVPADLSESTAQLSAGEIAAELAAGGAARAVGRKPSCTTSTDRRPATRPAVPKADGDAGPTPLSAVSTETLDADTGTLPASRPVPLRHSGDKIGGRYRLEECITQTETFSSWRAVDEKLRRAVGVHLMAAGHRRAKAVLTAARSAALLGDPRFVQVLDAVQEGDLVYVIREWLPGASDLAHLLADGPMEPYDAYQMVRQVTEAVAAAHRRGQAHLRLTPRCVLRTDTGQYRINGIAVDAALRGLPTDDAELTDTRAIGALLFAALTHRWPYPEDRYDLRGMPKSLGCVPPDQVRAGVHKGLSELAARALCTSPPHHKPAIDSPEELSKAIALMPKIRQPETPAPTFTPRTPKPAPAPQAAHHSAHHTARPTAPEPRPAQHHATYPDTPTTATRPPRRRRRLLRSALRATVSLVALTAIVVGSWQAVEYLHKPRPNSAALPSGLQPTPPGGQGASSAPLEGVTLAYTPTSFNAFGSEKAEHASSLPNISDGKPGTTWSTQAYQDAFGSGYRPGTGILLDLGTARTVGSVSVRLAGGTHTVELRATPAATTNAPPVSESGFQDFGGPTASASGTDLQLKPAKPITTRYLLIWLTAIPNDGGSYRGQVAEVTVNG